MGNQKAIENNSGRKKVLKKAAMLATIASITGACAVGGQKPKESEALIGAIIAAITTVVSIGASIGQTVSDGVQASNQKKMVEEEARRQQEEARRQQEEERIRAALESGEHNARANKAEEDSLKGKVVDMSSADNTSILEQQQREEMARARKRSNIKRPVAPPKGVNVGGFGASDDEINEVNEETNENLVNEVVEENIQTENETLGNNKIENIQPIYEEEQNVKEESTSDSESNKIDSNIVRLSLKDLVNSDESLNEKLNDMSGEEIFESLENSENDGEYVEFDDSALMSEKDAENHRLVKEGFLTAEELTLLDFGIRSGAITESVLQVMYENGDVTQEYYDGAMELLSEFSE